ncbi:MAG: YebC/PmpR family DNA-binding transcriptional regulator [Planctomycetes bacterium]|nr:YebC/PmpR family DNA-binding transcriptional regulator [Planctomycetota bacterium]
MAGHSKWANIQHRKGAQDKRRAKIFSKCSKVIMTAVKLAGPDPDMNLGLRYAIDKARQANMPRDNIARAIKAAQGAEGGDSYEEVMYEGYGAGGVAYMVAALTDNRNRTAPELRKIFERGGGKLGTSGSVMHQFERKALFIVAKEAMDEDAIMELALDSGADDVVGQDDTWEITGAPETFSSIRDGLAKAEIEPRASSVAMLPLVTVEIADEAAATRVLKLMDALDDHEDVDTVYANFDIPDAILEKVAP